MLETLDLKAKLAKADYKAAQDALDPVLASLQRKLHAAGVPAVVVFEGWDASGKGTVLGRLLQPLDPRGFKVHNIAPPTSLERFYPPMHRFWQKLPAHGTIGIFDRSWYRQVIEGAVFEGAGEPELRAAYEHIRVFERQLADSGTVLVKFFLGSSLESVGEAGLKQMHPATLWLLKSALEWPPKDSRDAVENDTQSRGETQGFCLRNALLWNR